MTSKFVTKHQAVYEKDFAGRWRLAIYPVGSVPKSSVNGSTVERSNIFDITEDCYKDSAVDNYTIVQKFPPPSTNVG